MREESVIPTDSSDNCREFDVLVVGAGFGGLAALHKLRDGLGYRVRVIEAGSGPGGTWYWNRYPGARCDVESLQYSLSFSDAIQQEWSWTERFAAQPDILAYAEFAVERLDMAKDIDFGRRVASATFDEQAAHWTLEADTGERYRARWLVMAAGPLSTPNFPYFPGLESFAGEVHHTGAWPAEAVSFAGKRVAQIGTGSSGIQIAPMIAREAQQLYLMQRTASHTVPARNRGLNPGEQEEIKAHYNDYRAQWRETIGATLWSSIVPAEKIVAFEKSALEVSAQERRMVFERAWDFGGYALHRSFRDILSVPEASDLVNAFIREKIAEVVQDPVTADLLTPRHYYGVKRVILDTDYYAIFNRPNVTLVDVKSSPIVDITPAGVRTADGFYDVDMIVLATGFDAMTGSLTRMNIRGRDGRLLGDDWKHGPRTYLGIMATGFPNMFMIGGPQSCSALANVITANEQQVDWIADCLAWLDHNGYATMETTNEAQDAWVDHVNALAEKTIFTKGDSWYLGSNIPGKPRAFLLYAGGFPAYRETCETIAAKGYEGFVVAPAG